VIAAAGDGWVWAIRDGEDRFDATVGLLFMIAVVKRFVPVR
jgi:hypothetical protein